MTVCERCRKELILEAASIGEPPTILILHEQQSGGYNAIKRLQDEINRKLAVGYQFVSLGVAGESKEVHFVAVLRRPEP